MRALALGNLHDGCLYASRCPIAQEICMRQKPALKEGEAGPFVACHMRS